MSVFSSIKKALKSSQSANFPNDLESLWMPFSANKHFKKKPRLISKAKGMYYYTPSGEKILDGVSDLRDESTEETRIVVELKMGEIERVTINKLFKLTALESSFGVILLALDRLRPRQLNIKEAIQCFVEHRRDVTLRRTNFRLRKAEDRAHILEGFKIALDNLDEFVRIIRASQNRNDAKDKLIE